MEFGHLRAFVTLAEEKHFGRAAGRLGISQPPLSRRIQQLEAELGVQLFARTSRSVELTAAGVAYLDAVRPHLDGLDDAAAALRRAQGKLCGKIRVGFVSNMAYDFVPRLVEALKRVAPNVAIEWSEAPSPEQQRALRERRIDAGLVLLPVSDPELRMRPLFREPIVALLPANHVLARTPALPLAALAKEKFVLCPRYRMSGYHETILGLCQAAGFKPLVQQEASSTAMTTELVASGMGVALVPRSGVPRKHPGVVCQILAQPASTVEAAVVWLEEAMNPRLRMFIDQAVKVAGSLPSI